MERKHADAIRKEYSGTGKKVVVLGIPDRYKYFQKELIGLLVSGTNGYLG
jgi:predicted protein tyrosine phosphatase